MLDKVQYWRLEPEQLEYLDSARSIMEEVLAEKHIIVNDIEAFDRFLLVVGQVYENLVTCKRYQR